jgi:hypothetical protein
MTPTRAASLLPLALTLAAALACREDRVDSNDCIDDACETDTGANESDDASETGPPESDTSEPNDTSDTVDTSEPPPEPSVRFIALGDGGEGNAAQHEVADVIAQVCARADRGCQFALYLGDNIYNTGVTSADDDQFRTKFEEPYADLNFPFFVALGNHDLGGDGLGVDIDLNKADYQVEYTLNSSKWRMYDKTYVVPTAEVPAEPASFFALNTTDMFFAGWGFSDQPAWIRGALAGSTSRWKIAFGHHPYISNGKHGDAGEYEGIGSWVPFSEIPRGQYVKDFLEEEICGKVDVYFAGHDHNRQWLGQAPDQSACPGTHFVVSGAAAKTTEARNDANSPLFEEYESEGFVWVEIVGDQLTGYFYDRNGVETGPFVIQK